MLILWISFLSVVDWVLLIRSSQGPIRLVSNHVTSFSRLLKQQIAVFVPYNFLSKLSTDIVTFSNIPAANIWYFLSPSPLPLTLTLPQPPAWKLSHGLGLSWHFVPFIINSADLEIVCFQRENSFRGLASMLFYGKCIRKTMKISAFVYNILLILPTYFPNI